VLNFGSTWTGLYYLAPACVLCQVIASIFLDLPGLLVEIRTQQPASLEHNNAEALKVAESQWHGGGTWVLFLICCSGFLGIVVNTASLLVIQSRSSLFMKSLVIVRNVGLVIWGVIVNGEVVSQLEVLGYTITLAAFVWYNHERQRAVSQPSVLPVSASVGELTQYYDEAAIAKAVSEAYRQGYDDGTAGLEKRSAKQVMELALVNVSTCSPPASPREPMSRGLRLRAGKLIPLKV